MLFRQAVGRPVVDAILDAVAAARPAESGAVRRRGSEVFAVRNLLRAVPAVREVMESQDVLALARELLGPAARPVKAILFDKNPAANWKVPWHQDLTITVRERRDTAGFGPWTVKAGVVCVQPPAAVLEKVAAFRLHLDDCGADNGALRLLPGSHRHGRLTAAEIAARRAADDEELCTAAAGDILAMSPLVLHASSPAQAASHRRVVHVEYTAGDLPNGLQWFDG